MERSISKHIIRVNSHKRPIEGSLTPLTITAPLNLNAPSSPSPSTLSGKKLPSISFTPSTPSSLYATTNSPTTPASNALKPSISTLKRKLKGTWWQRAVSVRAILLVFVALLVLLFSLTSAYTIDKCLKVSTQDFTEKILHSIVVRVAAELDCIFSPSHMMLKSAYLQLNNDTSDLGFERVQPILWRVFLESEGKVHSIKLVQANGSFVVYFNSTQPYLATSDSIFDYSQVGPVTDFSHGLSSQLRYDAGPDYDVRLNKWWQQVETQKTEIWTGAYRVYYLNSVQVFHSNVIPILNPNLLQYLEDLDISPNAVIWITEPSGAMVACSDPTENVYTINSTEKTYAQYSNIELVRETTLRILETNSFNTPQHNFKLHGNDIDSYVFTMSNNQIRLLIVVAYPRSDFLGVENEVQRHMVAISFISLVVALLIGIGVVFVVTVPLAQLGRQMIEVSLGKFDNPMFHRSNSRLYEINSLQQDFYRMVNAIKSFGKFIPIEVVRHLLIDDVEAEASVTQKEVTVLFSDIVGFTQKTEELDPSSFSTLLSDYLSTMCAVIGNNEGTVDKFIGDAIMALWNTPTQTPRHAQLACSAALQSLKALQDLNSKWKKIELPEIQVRIGIHTGKAIVGNFGSKERLAYTAVGNNINLGSRLESLNKKYGKDIDFRSSLPTIKGRPAPIQLYELVCSLDEANSEQLELCKLHTEAVELFFQRRFSESIAILNALQVRCIYDVSVKLLLERAMKAHNVADQELTGPNWTGFCVLED